MTLKLFFGNIFFGACALLLAFLTSHIIDALYRSRPDLIEWPLPSRSAVRARVFLLWIGFLVSIKGIWHTDYISSNPPLFIFLLIAAILLLAMTATDIEQHLLFDALTAPLAIAGLLCAACLALTTADVASLLLSRALASLGGGILFLIIAILTKGGIGGGGFHVRDTFVPDIAVVRGLVPAVHAVHVAHRDEHGALMGVLLHREIQSGEGMAFVVPDLAEEGLRDGGIEDVLREEGTADGDPRLLFIGDQGHAGRAGDGFGAEDEMQGLARFRRQDHDGSVRV